MPGYRSSAHRKQFALDRYFLGGRTSSEVTESDTPFTENLRALPSSLFASPCLLQIYQLQMGELGGYYQTKWGCSVVSHPLTMSGQLPAITCWSPLYCFPAIPRRGMGFIGVEFQSLSFSSTGADTSTKHQQPEVQALSSQCFPYFLPLFHIHSAPITAVVSSPSCYNECTNFKQPTASFLTAYTAAIQKD